MGGDEYTVLYDLGDHAETFSPIVDKLTSSPKWCNPNLGLQIENILPLCVDK